MMPAQSVSGIIREYYAAYESKDGSALERLLSADFRFSSPLDDRIDKAAYFERCWPNSERIRSFYIEKLFECGDEAFVRYELERSTGERFRNVEFFRIEGGKVKEVQVYFGRDTDERSSK
jgi:ketosteroid isomerase-like protein